MEKQEFKYKIGVSLYNEEEINEVMKFGIKPDIIQLPLNILDTRLYRKGVINTLFKNIYIPGYDSESFLLFFIVVLLKR